jgi:hypothetical protein
VLQKRTTVHHFSRRIPPGLLAERRFRLFQDRPALVPPRDFDFTSSGRRHQPGTCTSCSSKRHPVSPKPFLSFHFHRLGSEHLLLKKKSEERFRRVLAMAICSVGGERVSVAPPDRSASRAFYHRHWLFCGAAPVHHPPLPLRPRETDPFPSTHTIIFPLPPRPGPGARKVACAAHRLAPEPLLHCTGNGRERFSRPP